ncbi:hypothetical protein XA68_11161 [Ophiocordyceps unilateralis]|uniref:tRNA(Ile)-lysidine synthetase n=1 Tax=Ophiocordyceps unilateralis TaxID=268505 RepID=A0A2A9PFP5_OPHUN|nr:hypothetical protein XA68_11161 [Ophiocordyceps unilateralis]
MLRRIPKPISPAEFRDAVEALLCRPNLTTAARHGRPQTVALAVSGGVDSIAMAFLFSRLLTSEEGIRTAGGTVRRAVGIVIDHRLRPGSDQEALCVAHELRKLSLGALVKRLRWTQAGQANMESLARTMRYRLLGVTCRRLHARNLFFAHHRDDQYETVLMRLLAGHGYRGLGAIPDSNAIPECSDLYGVYKSGLDDANSRADELRNFLRNGPDQACHRLEMSAAMVNPSIPDLRPLDCEDGGIMIHRPLLEFDKDRLIATCEANELRWFEDNTNSDPTLTMRNAVRHLVKSHQLPRALQKPAILALSKRSRRRSKAEESEAHRLLVREAVLRHFNPNVGTLTIKLPSSRSRRPRSLATSNARQRHQRLVAAAAIRKLIDFVTPEIHLPPLSNLDGAVDRLFPALRSGPDRRRSEAFTMSGVLFRPAEGAEPTKWHLSRTPYPSSRPVPQRIFLGRSGSSPLSGHRWRSWKAAKLWDGRFWLQITCQIVSPGAGVGAASAPPTTAEASCFREDALLAASTIQRRGKDGHHFAGIT